MGRISKGLPVPTGKAGSTKGSNRQGAPSRQDLDPKGLQQAKPGPHRQDRKRLPTGKAVLKGVKPLDAVGS